MAPLLSLLLTLLGLSISQQQITSTNLSSTAGRECEKNGDCVDKEICRPNDDGVKYCVAQNQSSNSILDILTKRAVSNKCERDSDCKSAESCKSNADGVKQCRDACSGKPCGKNANCTVTNHLPVCSCRSGYTGDPFVNCEPKSQTRSSNKRDITENVADWGHLTQRDTVSNKCKEDNDCKSAESCRPNADGVKQCDDACSGKPCGKNANCTVTNHLAVCSCRSGYTGDPFINCEPKSQTRSSNKRDITENVGLTADWGHLTQRDTDEHTCEEDSECPANTVCRQDSAGLRKCLDEVISTHAGGCSEDVCTQFCGASGMKGTCEEVVDQGEKKCFCHK